MQISQSSYTRIRTHLHHRLDGQEITHCLNPNLDFKVANFFAQETVVLPTFVLDPCIRLIFTLRGQTNLTIKGTGYQLQAGTERSAAILPVNEDELGNKTFYMREHQHEIVIFIKKSFFEQPCSDIEDSAVEQLFTQHLQLRYITVTPFIAQLLNCLSTYTDGSKMIHRLQNESIVLSLLAEVLQQVNSASPVPVEGGLHQRIEHIVAMIDSAQAIDWDIKKIANMCHTNPTTLQAVFKQKYGITIAAYRRAKLLKKASYALLRGASVKSAAHIAGYRDMKSFTQAFVRQFNQHPSQFKRL